MKTKLQFLNYKHELVDAPKELAIEIANHADGLVVWSRGGKKNHQVRYALQVKTFTDSMEAAQEFGECVHHAAECVGIV